jgi:hypothetical protein
MKTFVIVLGLLFGIQSAFAAQPKIFKMYRKPHAKVDSFCDVYTKLELNVNGNGGSARLSNHVAGVCEIAVQENPRSYNLVLGSTDCGTKTYRQDDDADNAVEVTDNRGRLCENVIPALIVVKEYDQNGNESVLYSKDQ